VNGCAAAEVPEVPLHSQCQRFGPELPFRGLGSTGYIRDFATVAVGRAFAGCVVCWRTSRDGRGEGSSGVVGHQQQGLRPSWSESVRGILGRDACQASTDVFF